MSTLRTETPSLDNYSLRVISHQSYPFKSANDDNALKFIT
jgi:hypothetical protein